MAVMLMTQLFSQVQRMSYKPPATLLLVGLQVALHYLDTSHLFSSLREVCLNPVAIIRGNRTLTRLLLSGFLHGDDMHLYYNMASLLWKGANLEQRMGTQRFVVMVAFLLVSSHILVVASAFFAADILGYPGLLQQCAVRDASYS
jgi:rhomboid domain-containing protein 1